MWRKKKTTFHGWTKIVDSGYASHQPSNPKGVGWWIPHPKQKKISHCQTKTRLCGVSGVVVVMCFFQKKNSTAKSPNLPKFILKRTRLSCRIPPPRESLHVGHPFGSPVWEVSMWGRKRRGWHGWWLKSGDHQLRLVVFIPLFTGFYTSKRWLFGMSEPSTVWLMH